MVYKVNKNNNIKYYTNLKKYFYKIITFLKIYNTVSYYNDF